MDIHNLMLDMLRTKKAKLVLHQLSQVAGMDKSTAHACPWLILKNLPKTRPSSTLMPLNIHTSTFLLCGFLFLLKKYLVFSSISILFQVKFKNPPVKQFLSYTFSNYFYIDVSP